jgi:hypothetical protein
MASGLVVLEGYRKQQRAFGARAPRHPRSEPRRHHRHRPPPLNPPPPLVLPHAPRQHASTPAHHTPLRRRPPLPPIDRHELCLGEIPRNSPRFTTTTAHPPTRARRLWPLAPRRSP